MTGRDKRKFKSYNNLNCGVQCKINNPLGALNILFPMSFTCLVYAVVARIYYLAILLWHLGLCEFTTRGNKQQLLHLMHDNVLIIGHVLSFNLRRLSL